MKKLFTLLLGLTLTASAFGEWINMKNLKVAVLDVVSRVSGETVDTATLSEMLQVALVDKHEFQIVERSLLDKILKEQEFQVSGLTEGQAAKVGKLAGADKVMILSVAKLADRYIFIVKGVDTKTGIVDLTDQILSLSIGGFIDIFPTLADRLVRKARGETIPAYQLAPGRSDASPAPAASGGPTAEIGGVYRAQGTNPDGSAYRGTCEISLGEDGEYQFEWTIGSSNYTGTGRLNGNTLTVDWGDTYPVVYQVLQGGKVLQGTWSGGKAKETLTR